MYLIQADIFSLPFKKEIFYFVYSFGVLQHTPDAKAAFYALPQYIKKGGDISICVYAYNWAIVLSSKFWRFFTNCMPKENAVLFFIYCLPALLYIFNTSVKKVVEDHFFCS